MSKKNYLDKLVAPPGRTPPRGPRKAGLAVERKAVDPAEHAEMEKQYLESIEYHLPVAFYGADGELEPLPKFDRDKLAAVGVTYEEWLQFHIEDRLSSRVLIEDGDDNE